MILLLLQYIWDFAKLANMTLTLNHVTGSLIEAFKILAI